MGLPGGAAWRRGLPGFRGLPGSDRGAIRRKGGGPTAATLSFTGNVSLPETHNGLAFTLVVLNNPGGAYDTFAETSDASGIATLAGDEVSISGLDYESATSHTLGYSATASGNPGLPTLTLTVTITVTDYNEQYYTTYLSHAQY